MQTFRYTPLAVVSRARKDSTGINTATDSTNLDVSSKEGAVIGAVLSTRKSLHQHKCVHL
jgi:hypothetical protein